MRANIEFEVTGATLFDLYGEAATKFRTLSGDPEVKLPHSAHMEVRPEVETHSGDVLGWRGTVSVLVSEIAS